MQKKSRVLITGANGMVGSALVRLLKQINEYQLLLPSRSELDLRNQKNVGDYFAAQQPDYVFHLAAIVGGIHANAAYPAKFIYDNTQMHSHVIHACYEYKIKKLLFPGSACTYPKLANQPIHESSFLDGLIEPTNLAYAAAKINGIVMCQAYAKEHRLKVVIPMPTNAYGINDNFDTLGSHVIPALMKRFHEGVQQNVSEMVLWGSGKPLREFIYVDDLADAFYFLMQSYDRDEIINIGSMQEISIQSLAEKIAGVVGFKGEIKQDTTKPDGAPRKCLDSNKLFNMGWRPKTSLDDGLKKMYEYHFLQEDTKAAAVS